MARTDISAADYTAMNVIDQTSETPTDFRRIVDTAEQDLPGVRYYPAWSKWFGYYKNIPELQASIVKLAEWAVGRGFKADKKTTERLDRVKGCGKDTFDSIIFNAEIVKKVCGDSFAEIIKNKRGELRNLKPINPGSMVVLSNSKGIISQYQQVVIPQADNKKGVRGKGKIIKFKPDEIFHLMNNRLGDEPHGRSDIEKLVTLIDSKNEAMKDLRIVFHRYVKPLIISELDTDDPAEIAAFKAKLDKAVLNMENMIIPKDTATVERVSIPQYSTLDPLPWIRYLQNMFIVTEGIPEVIMGFGQETTEASAKILYLAFQQKIESEQLYLEQQIKAQIGLDVEFNFPADIAPHMIDDIKKEGDKTAAIQK